MSYPLRIEGRKAGNPWNYEVVSARAEDNTTSGFGEGAVAFIDLLRDGVISVEIFNGRCHECNHVEVGICDTRAADSIRIHFDFSRDGYVIEQASVFEWDAGDEECDQDWQEVAFIQAWAREGGGA